MATELFASNLATTVVTSGGTDAPVSGTTETWTVASPAMFGAASTGVSQFHVADPGAPTEMIAVTNVSGTTWTVTRGAESTVPVSHTGGFTVCQVTTAGWLAATAQLGAGGLAWLATEHGLKCDNATDDTAAFLALLATVYSAGGGTIVFPSMSYCAGQVSLPNDGNAPPNQPPVRLTSASAPDRVGTSNSRTGYLTGGLRLAYAGRTDTGCGTTSGSAAVTDPSAVSADLGAFVTGPGIPDKAQVIAVTPGTGYTLSYNALAAGSSVSFSVFGGRIVSTGCGYLEIDHLMLISGSASTPAPFGWSTNTVVSIHDCTFQGNTSKTGLTCNEDSWVFGGSVHTFTGATSQSTAQAFQGYGSTFERNFLTHIRRTLMLEDCSSLWYSHNVNWQTCGSNLTNVTTLTSALTSTDSYTSLAVAALNNPVYAGDTIQIGNGGTTGATTTQQVTASAYAAAGATSISVNSFTANANYSTGTQVTDYTTGLSAPLESAATAGFQSNLAAVEFSRFEMTNNYTHVTIFRNSTNGHIIGCEIQDTNASNVACHYFDASSTSNLIIAGEVSTGCPLVDGTAQTVLDPRGSSFPATFQALKVITGSTSSFADGWLPALTDSSGNKWQALASSGTWTWYYTASGGSQEAVAVLQYGSVNSVTLNLGTVNAGGSAVVENTQGQIFLRSGATYYLALGDSTYTTNVKVQNGQLEVAHLISQVSSGYSAPTVAAASSSTSLSITGSDTAHNVQFTTAASIGAGSSVATVTFGQSYSALGPAKTPRFALTPKNGASAAAQAYVTGDSYTGYSIALQNPPAGATAMVFDVHVIGG